jgi:DeoR family fructose operon transcriptional repressor
MKQLAEALYVSEATARRDVELLEKRGLVRRVYGGVVLKKEEMPLEVRLQERAAQKEEIAAKAADMIFDGATVFLDASSTVLHLVPLLTRFRDLVVVTNGYRAAELLAGGKCRVILTGGELSPRNMALVGSVAEETLARLSVDIAFFSSEGISEEGEITDSSEKETALRRVLLRRAARTVLLMDSSKMGKRYLFHLANAEELSSVITDSGFPAECPWQKEAAE